MREQRFKPQDGSPYSQRPTAKSDIAQVTAQKKAAMTQTNPEMGDGRLAPMKALSADTSRQSTFTAGLLSGLAQEADGEFSMLALQKKTNMLTSKSREKFPPWDPQSQRYQLHKTLETFRDRLPRDLALTQANLSAHLSAGPPTPYILLHTTLLLCGIVLHRDYIPFLPLRCTKPQGPLDPPLFPVDQYQTPPDWWEESAKDLFRSARVLINLLRV